jgi:hypothetical protein
MFPSWWGGTTRRPNAPIAPGPICAFASHQQLRRARFAASGSQLFLVRLSVVGKSHRQLDSRCQFTSYAASPGQQLGTALEQLFVCFAFGHGKPLSGLPIAACSVPNALPKTLGKLPEVNGPVESGGSEPTTVGRTGQTIHAIAVGGEHFQSPPRGQIMDANRGIGAA